ncbi:unnamed protein product [Peronospora farinosa]|uniref:SAP domain-containing protein n=1 Tax=Peronospora farinosa TaxID=134698 RepID=A0AAV0ST15_9STRA|nr:unnamed protein product [Peronospora farinosa]CAI5707640.1 unnamed protein product [Peronospora farinosa]
MGDAVLRVQSHLQSLARENWSALEEKHVYNISWLRNELTEIARSLEIKSNFEYKPVPMTSFCRAENVIFDVSGPARKKHKIEKQVEDMRDVPAMDKEERERSRRSMQLRPRAVSMETTMDIDTKSATRKREQPSLMLLQDVSKLKVVDLRLELKKRGLKTSGRKVVLCDRLLEALEKEEKEEMEKKDEIVEETREREVIVIDDDCEGDEIVRESMESSRSVVTSQLSQEVAAEDEKEKETRVSTPVSGDGQHPSFLQTSEEDVSKTECVLRTVKVPSSVEIASEADSVEQRQRQLLSDSNIASPVGNTRDSVELAAADGPKELIAHDVLRVTRKSMQVGGQSELSSPFAWKRKSILRKASSLASCTHGPVRNVSFAPTDKMYTIVDSSQTDSTQPEPSPEKAPSPIESHTLRDETKLESKFTGLDIALEDNAKLKIVSTNVAPASASIIPQDSIPAMSVKETEEQRKKREFDETVQREAEKFRLAAKLSVQKRLEEVNASKALWAKGDQLKARLRASSAGDKRKSARTPLSLNEKSAFDQVSPPISESSTASESTSTSSDSNRSTTSVLKDETRTLHTTRLAAEEAKEQEFIRSMSREQETKSTPNMVSGSLHDLTAPHATHAMVDIKHQVERSMSHQLIGMPAAKSLPATERMPQELSETHAARLDIESQQLQRPSFVSSTTSSIDGAESEPPNIHSAKPMSNRDRSDSLSSTVSSIPEQSIVENALKSAALTVTNANRRPITNLVSGVHSFTTLLEKKNTQEGNRGRSAPVINALKLAEKSRVLEEKKRLEKEGRKAILKRKMEEHRKVAALKEKAEKDAQAKREQERLNVRKKREAELARQRQQKLKEMRAGLEKKRAMLAAEKKAVYSSSATLLGKSTTSATMASHHKHRGLTPTPAVPQPTAKPISKPLQKLVSKQIPKSVSNALPASKSASKPMPKPASRLPMASPVPAKHAPKSHSPEVVNYEMSDNAESSDGDSGDSDADRHGKKKVPRWAQKDHLNKVLHAQFGKNAIDPSPAIFQDFVDTCNLEAIFETNDVHKKKKFARRTSSGNWLADRPTARDRALYQRDMGYDR